MARIFYLHWNEQELAQRTQELAAAGHDVHGHWSTENTAKFKDSMPDVFVISLDRLPSHGKAYADWLWEAKKRRSIQLVFAGGKPEKVEPFRTAYPTAIFCAPEGVKAALDSFLQNGPAGTL